MKKLFSLLTAFALVAGNVFAAGPAIELPKQPWTFQDVRSDWDKATIYRGYQVATQVCLSCHGFKYIKHRDLMKVGFTENEVKKLAGEMDISIDDTFKAAMSEEDMVEVYAKVLPDLSVMNKARPGGADYVHALLTGYEDAPSNFDMPETGYYNKYFPGHVIAMPAPLSEGQVEYFDGTNATVEQMSKDVTYFMQWTAEPELTARQQLGVYVLLYVFILTILLYFTKRRIWRDIKKKDDDE